MVDKLHQRDKVLPGLVNLKLLILLSKVCGKARFKLSCDPCSHLERRPIRCQYVATTHVPHPTPMPSAAVTFQLSPLKPFNSVLEVALTTISPHKEQ